ncbi:DUF4255 domain-containing protein [Tundrisphaera lichenicola]|uniref:DUF4255 domain-containing protein n=1 Tax=Tundrisphaera lichenicola TaxID=2029860 RepID=UPI003EB8D3D0
MAGIQGVQKVTSTLGSLLLDRMETAGVIVSFGVPKTDDTGDVPRVNLFLYHVKENPHLRNEDDPRRQSPGEFGSPPMPLELGYLITSYGRKNAEVDPGFLPGASQSELEAQQTLADVMRVFHEAAILNPKTMRLKAPGGPLLDSGLRQEFESIKITPRSLDLDDLSKLWTAIKADFQRAVAYHVSVIRVDSMRPRSSSLPVLERSITVAPALAIGPGLVDLQPSSVAAGEPVTLVGDRFGDPSLAVILADSFGTGFPRSPAKLAVTRDSTGVHFTIPNDPALFQPGLKTVSARIDLAGGRVATSEPRPLQLLPKVDLIVPSAGPFDGTVTVRIQGTMLGIDNPDTRHPLRPSVFFGNYAVPDADLDLSGLPALIKATLKIPADPDNPASPRVGRKLPVRVRLNGVENQTWRANVSGGLDMDPALVFEVT